jgi:hypothetical protein
MEWESFKGDSQHTTKSGSTFTLPDMWKMGFDDTRIVLESPDPDLHVARRRCRRARTRHTAWA